MSDQPPRTVSEVLQLIGPRSDEDMNQNAPPGTPEAMIRELHDLGLLERAVRNALGETARAAREIGLSWREIGKAAGCTAQNAFQRWAKRPEASLRTMRAATRRSLLLDSSSGLLYKAPLAATLHK